MDFEEEVGPSSLTDQRSTMIGSCTDGKVAGEVTVKLENQTVLHPVEESQAAIDQLDSASAQRVIPEYMVAVKIEHVIPKSEARRDTETDRDPASITSGNINKKRPRENR